MVLVSGLKKRPRSSRHSARVKLTIRLWRPLSTRSQRERFPVFEKSRYSSSGKAGTGSRDSLRAWGTTEAKAGACAIFPHAARSVIGLQCVRTREKPVSDVEFGLHVQAALNMALLSFLKGKVARFDFKKQQIVL